MVNVTDVGYSPSEKAFVCPVDERQGERTEAFFRDRGEPQILLDFRVMQDIDDLGYPRLVDVRKDRVSVSPR